MNGARPGPVSPCMDTATNVTPIKPKPAPMHHVSKFALKALVTFTCGPDRPNLARVFVSADGSTMVTTDGNALLLRHDPMAGAGGMRPAEIKREGSCVTVDACKAAIKACPAGAEIVIDPSTGAITVEQGAHVLADRRARRLGLHLPAVLAGDPVH